MIANKQLRLSIELIDQLQLLANLKKYFFEKENLYENLNRLLV
jgi:hypothetical protein